MGTSVVGTAVDGDAVKAVGFKVSLLVGSIVGCKEGLSEGFAVMGRLDGDELGTMDGKELGNIVGCKFGDEIGISVGKFVGGLVSLC